jgi:hypothetical protein
MQYDTRTYEGKFAQRWLCEMPRRTGYPGSPLDFYNIESLINEMTNVGYQILSFGNELYGLDTGDTKFFWLGNDMQIVTELHSFERAMAVSVTAKNPDVTSHYHASDLYQSILNQTNIPLLFSGEQMSTGGEGIWRWLMKNGNVLAYKPNDPKHFKRLRTTDDFESLIGDTDEFTQYRFILSPNNMNLMEHYSSFEMMRIYRNVHGISNQTE